MTLSEAGALFRSHTRVEEGALCRACAKMQESIAYCKKWQEDAAGAQSLVQENHKTRRCGLTVGRKSR